MVVLSLVLRGSIRGHSKSTFVEERGGGGERSLKSEQKQTRVGRSWHACTFAFLKKMLRFSNLSYSPVFPIDYNGSMKY